MGLLRTREKRQGNRLITFISCLDNVHYQHAAQMIRALTEAEIKFRVQVRSELNLSRNSFIFTFFSYKTFQKLAFSARDVIWCLSTKLYLPVILPVLTVHTSRSPEETLVPFRLLANSVSGRVLLGLFRNRITQNRWYSCSFVSYSVFGLNGISSSSFCSR